MAASPSLRSVIPWEESAAQSALHRGINKMHAQRASMIPTEFRGVQGLEDRVRPRRIIVIAADAQHGLGKVASLTSLSGDPRIGFAQSVVGRAKL